MSRETFDTPKGFSDAAWVEKKGQIWLRYVYRPQLWWTTIESSNGLLVLCDVEHFFDGVNGGIRHVPALLPEFLPLQK